MLPSDVVDFLGNLTTKVAKVRTPLLPHQQRVVDRLQQDDQPGLVAIHGLGSGKTLTSIAAQEALKMRSQVVAPAALLGNYAKERKKHLTGKSSRADLTSMQNMATKGKSPDAPFLVVDEAHRARDPSSATFQTLKGNTAQKRLLLSGSPFYNHPSDIAPLIDLAADANVLPYNKEDFTRRYITEKVVKPSIGQRLLNVVRSDENKVKPGTVPILYDKMAPELRDAFSKWVDYHPGSTENFPEVTHEDVNVPMSSHQLKVYDTLMDKAPAWVAAKVKRGLPPNKREAQQLNAFLTASRQAANTTAPFIQEGTPESPKIQAAFERMQKTLTDNPKAKGVVYSNYLGAGLDPYKKMLEGAGIPYGEFTGEVPSKKRDQLVSDYNAGKVRTLLLSGAGGEGLDLKGTRLLQMLEPHWNAERGKQVEGRGARYMSHADLPPEERKLRVERYLSTRPQGMITSAYNKLTGRAPDKSVDEYLTQMSTDKENLINQFKALLPADKTAAKKVTTSEESRELASSWKPRLAAEVAYALPTALAFAGMGNAMAEMVRAPREGKQLAAAIGGATGLGMGHLFSQAMAGSIVGDAKRLARDAVRHPQKENVLREQAGKLDWGQVMHSAASHMVGSVPSMLSISTPLGAALLGGSLAAGALGAVGSGYLDKYKRQIALNELESVRSAEGARDAEKLHRLRRQVSSLEEKVDGDGWKVTGKAVHTKPVAKDRSGKDW